MSVPKIISKQEPYWIVDCRSARWHRKSAQLDLLRSSLYSICGGFPPFGVGRGL